VDARDGVALGGVAGARDGARRDGDGVEAGLAVGDEVAVAHDEAGADAADAEILTARQTGQVVERSIHWIGFLIPARSVKRAEREAMIQCQVTSGPFPKYGRLHRAGAVS